MKTDEIKRIVFAEGEGENRFLSQREFDRRKKAVLKKLRSMDPQGEEAEKKWFRENAPLLIQTLKDTDGKRFRLAEGSERVMSALLETADFEGSREEMVTLAESISLVRSFRDGEAESLWLSFLLLLSERIARDPAENYPTDFSRFHRLLDIQTEGIAQGFSPLEQILRGDPDGTYPKMDRATQIQYQTILRKMAKREGKSPEGLAGDLVEKAKQKREHLGFFLKKPLLHREYIPLIFVLFFALLIPFILVTRSLTLSVLVALPLYFFSRNLVVFCYGVLIRPKKLFSMKPETITAKEKTAVIITSVITSEKDIDRLGEKIRRFAVNNREAEDEVYFGLLCDFCESKTREKEGDEALFTALKEKTAQWNQIAPCFFSVIRKRKYHPGEKSWCGWERKRGAVMQLCQYLRRGDLDPDMLLFGEKERIVGSRYLLTLDSDTELSLDQVRRLVAIAEHPMNRPVIREKKGRAFVSSGFGMLQPRINSSLLSPIRTRFGKIFANGGGEIPYASASFEPMQSLFGEGNFCGKGLIHVDAFCQIMPSLLPEGVILSHDMPEGAALRCGLVSHEFFTDSDPQDAKSRTERLHRWIRGDTQNLFYLFRLPGLRRFFAIENFLEYLSPLCQVAFLVVSAFVSPQMACAALALVLLFHLQSFLATVLSMLLTGNVQHFSRRFSTKIRNLILNEIYRFLFSLAELCSAAYYQTDAILRSLYRSLVSHRRMLQWKVYRSASDGKGKLRHYLPPFLLSLILAVVTVRTAVSALFCFTLFYPVLCEFLALPYEKKKAWKKEEREQLLAMAREEFRFFDRTVGENTNYLPPDNLQLQPVEKLAMRTSPTNIGLYLASLLAAADLEFISLREMKRRIDRALDRIEVLEKYQGNLFNWYDLESLAVIGDRFVSTVDSGNFLACLVVLASGIREVVPEEDGLKETLNRVEKLICETDLRPLYRAERGLFSVGVKPDTGEYASNYDLYMSEARITGFLAIALGQVSFRHWKNLRRPLLSFRSRVGAASWSGTAFEYFMPPLFLPVVENSLEDESLDFALHCQREYAVCVKNKGSLFGVSESGYSATDQQNNYQYKAFGVPYLSLEGKRSANRVLAPYASFLMLERKDPAVLTNLFQLEQIGMKGAFGFFESCEFDRGENGKKSIVYSYMAHHKGMSILALTNALKDNVFQKRFFAYGNIAAKKELLAERFPLEEKVAKRKKLPEEKGSLPQRQESKGFSYCPEAHNTFLFSDGATGLFCSDDGKMTVKTHDLVWFDHMKIRLISDGDVLAPGEKGVSAEWLIHPFGFDLQLKKGRVHAVLHWELLAEENALSLCARVYGSDAGAVLELCFDPRLCREEEYRAHPAFTALSREISRTGETLVIHKRTMGEDSFLQIRGVFPFTCLVGEAEQRSAFEPKVLQEKLTLRISLEKSKSRRAPLIFSLERKEEGRDLYPLLDGSFEPLQDQRDKAALIAQRLEETCSYDEACRILQRQILTCLFRERQMIVKEGATVLPKDFLWRLGISGDHPLITVMIRSEDDLTEAKNVLRVFKKLFLSKIAADLVFAIEEERAYFAPLREALTDMMGELSAEFLLDRSPGIHFADGTDGNLTAGLITLSKAVFGSEEVTRVIPGSERLEERVIRRERRANEGGKVGEFIPRGFAIHKNRFCPGVPFSMVSSNRRCGFVCDQNSLGFTWYRNAGLGRISRWNGGTDLPGEKLYLLYEEQVYDLLDLADEVRYRDGAVSWEGEIQGRAFRVFLQNSEKLGGKTVCVCLEDALAKNAHLIFSFYPTLSRSGGVPILLEEHFDHLVLSPAMEGEICQSALFYADSGIQELREEMGNLHLYLPAKAENLLFLGGFSSPKNKEYVLRYLRSGDMEKAVSDELTFLQTRLPAFEDEREYWFAYQTLFSRFYGRTGWYQSSGAYGFRDQLQDAMILLEKTPEIAKQHLLRCAAHQFEEGDVQHWWHPGQGSKGRGDPGVRTACSDDYLWLLYGVAQYLKQTGDQKILEIPVPFLKDDKGPGSVHDRYFTPELGEIAPLREHLIRCVSLLLSRGTGLHGLAKMGSGDWNDGMNQVGGESVWLSEFAAICLHRILPVLPEEMREKGNAFLAQLLDGIRASFNGSWFARAYRDNGDELGNDLSLESECSIDLLPQSFAALLYCEMGSACTLEARDIRKALLSAWDILAKDDKILLFTKPFVKTDPSPGYIQRYAAGVRENGGQYSHGAVWFALALLRFGRKTQDEELIHFAHKAGEILDPGKNITVRNHERYGREPYVMCGDVYNAPGAQGQGGWSWYTGAAGWYYQFLKEEKEEPDA